MKKYFKLQGIFILVLLLITFTGCKEKTQPFLGLRIDVISTGKSDCIVIKENDNNILIDLAEDDDNVKVKNYIKNLGITSFDLVVLSHFDKDHIGTALTTLSSFDVNEMYVSDYVKDSVDYSNYLLAIEKNGINPTKITQKKTKQIGEMTVSIIPASLELMQEDNDNNKSLIVDISYCGKHFTFLGDAMKKRVEEYLLDVDYESLFLKYPHHGSYNDSTINLLSKLSPKYVAITCSKKQPADDDTLSLLTEKGISYYTTVSGHIVMQYDGVNEIFKVR